MAQERRAARIVGLTREPALATTRTQGAIGPGNGFSVRSNALGVWGCGVGKVMVRGQAFVIVAGRSRAKIGDLEVIWLAWSEGA